LFPPSAPNSANLFKLIRETKRSFHPEHVFCPPKPTLIPGYGRAWEYALANKYCFTTDFLLPDKCSADSSSISSMGAGRGQGLPGLWQNMKFHHCFLPWKKTFNAHEFELLALFNYTFNLGPVSKGFQHPTLIGVATKQREAAKVIFFTIVE